MKKWTIFPGNLNHLLIGRPIGNALRLFALALTMWIAAPAYAQNMVTKPVNRADRAMLLGHHPAWANSANEVGSVPADMQLTGLTLILARPAAREKALEQFMKDQQNPASPNYHHWLTPVEFGTEFGVSTSDIDAIRAWMQSEGLTLDSTASSLTRIRFSGTAAAVAGAFGAEMRYYKVNSEKRISISDEAQIPAALAGVIKSVSGLHNVKLRPMHRIATQELVQNQAGAPNTSIAAPRMISELTAHASGASAPLGTFTCGGSPCSFVTPGDFTTIYNVSPVYANNFHGEGQTIAIIGQSAVNPDDITNFQMRVGLPQVAPTVIVPPNGVAPPAAATTTVANPSGDQLEATLDVTRAGSIAYGATIDLIVSGDTKTANGLDIATEYAVDTTPVLAHVMSISFGACEAQNVSGVHFWDSLFQQAAAEGISVFVSSGDAGAAGCDDQFSAPPTTQIASPNYICSSSFATCVGGTEFADASNLSMYWGTTNGTGLQSALSYIPEGAWNEPTDSSGKFQIAASGGGVSSVIPAPSWQTGTGVPVPSMGRYTPDVSFSSSIHDGYFACVAASGSSCVGTSSFQFTVFGGTSAAAPDMAGIAALLNQSAGSAQGNLNPTLYQLAAEPSLNVFNDATAASSAVSGCAVGTPSMCNNSTPGSSSLTGGLSGFSVGAGFDEATGLGSINVANLIANWKPTSVTPTNPVPAISAINPTSGFAGQAISTFTVTGTNFVSGATVVFNGTTNAGTVFASGTVITTSIAASEVTGGTTLVSVVNPLPGGGKSNSISFVVDDFSVLGPTQSQTITAGQSATFTISIGTQGAALQVAVTFSASNLPPNSTASFSPPTIGAGNSSGATTLTISTTAHGAVPLGFGPAGRMRLILPTLFTLLALCLPALSRFRTGDRSRLQIRPVPALIVPILLVCAVFSGGCGSSGSASVNPGGGTATGTAAGTYSVIVTVTEGSVAHSTTVTLVVQ